MAIDTASYISGMNLVIPANGDKAGEGAGQIRAVKTATKNSFPNINARMHVSSAQLNSLFPTDGQTVPNMAMLGEVRILYALPSSVLPPWYVCDGTNGTPDLMDKFLMFGVNFGALGGSNEFVIPGQTTSSTALSANQIPQHKHEFTGDDKLVSTDPYFKLVQSNAFDVTAEGGDGWRSPKVLTNKMYNNNNAEVGGGEGHTHTVVGATVPTVPEYVTLLPIMFIPTDAVLPPPSIPLDIVLQPIDQNLKHSDEPYTISAAWHVPEEFDLHTQNVQWVLEEMGDDGAWGEVATGSGAGMAGITHVIDPVTGKVSLKED